MTSSSEQPPYEMQAAYVLTKDDWLRIREHLTIGCTNQKAFLDTLRPHSAPSINSIDLEKVETRELIQHYGRVLVEIESRGVTW